MSWRHFLILIGLVIKKNNNNCNNLFSDTKKVLECRSFTLNQQFTPKYKEPGNHNSGEDMLRTCESPNFWCCSQIELGVGSLDPLVEVSVQSGPPPHAPVRICRLVEVSVPAASGLPQPGAAGWTDRNLCLLLP